MRLLLARGVWAIHTAIVVFVCIAWALPWTQAIWAAVIVYPMIQLNWWVFRGRCVLTILEEKLRGSGASVSVQEATEEFHFLQDLGMRLFGRPVARIWADVVAYAVLWGGFAIASVRLYLRVGAPA